MVDYFSNLCYAYSVSISGRTSTVRVQAYIVLPPSIVDLVRYLLKIIFYVHKIFDRLSDPHVTNHGSDVSWSVDLVWSRKDSKAVVNYLFK